MFWPTHPRWARTLTEYITMVFEVTLESSGPAVSKTAGYCWGGFKFRSEHPPHFVP
jgi:hypothetical protein